MSQSEIWVKVAIPLIAAFIGAFGGTYLAFIWQKKLRKHQDKKELLGTLMGYRYAAFKQPEFVKALNMVDIVFHDNEKVKELLHKYFLYTSNDIYSGGVRVETFFDLLLEMGRDIGYKRLKHSDIHDFYNPGFPPDSPTPPAAAP